MYARTNSDFLVNDPAGFPSAYQPVSWLSDPGGGSYWWTGSDAGGGAVPIGPNGPWSGGYGPGRAVVTRATQLITGPLTASPFRLHAAGQVGRMLEPPRWLADPMLLRPDDRFPGGMWPSVVLLPRSLFWSTWVRDALWWGTGAFLCQEDATGQPVAGSLRIVDPRFLYPERDGGGVLCWCLAAEAGDPEVEFSREGYLTIGGATYRLVVLRSPLSPVDSEGRSVGVFESNPDVFRLAGQIDTYASGTFRSGVPAGYLKTETPGLTQEQADKLKAAWLRNHGGDRRSIAVLNATTTFTPLQMSPVDAALAEVKRLSIADVAFAFNEDPLMFTVTLGNSATYATTQAAFQWHKGYSLAPWISAVQDVLTSLMPGTQGVVVNLDDFERPPAKERFEGYQVAIDSGVMTEDECRFLEGLPPLEDQPQPVQEPGDQVDVVEEQQANVRRLTWPS